MESKLVQTSALAWMVVLVASLLLAFAGCSGGSPQGHDEPAATEDGGWGDGDALPVFDDGGTVSDDGVTDAGLDAGTDAGAGDDGGPGDLLQQLQALTAKCTVASNGKYATDQGETATIDICRLNGAFFWKSDMDIDCDGQTTTECNPNTDPWYQNQTSFNQSDGQPLIASLLPYIVVPLPSTRFSYQSSGIKPGAAAIVIYNGQINYGVFGDEGPSGIIGEASYALANSLGIDPDPSTGGVDSGVTFIVFTGQAAVVSPIEDHQAAVSLGQQLAVQLLANN